MHSNYSMITDISMINSLANNRDDYKNAYKEGILEDTRKWVDYKISKDIPKLGESINSRLRNRMSQLSLGIFNVIDNGPGKNLSEEEEIYLFTGFGEIETTNQIIKTILIDKYLLVSPTLFHNSVHHTALGYYSIIMKKHNPCITISDGLITNFSFIHFINKKLLLNKNIVISTGEEYSPFFELDKLKSLEILPVFASYRINVNSKIGFKYIGESTSIAEIKDNITFKNSTTIIADKDAFIEIKEECNKKVLTEYPLILDNPCSLLFRLALPFYLEIAGVSLVIQKLNSKYYFYEVKL